jgi:putative endonuclease
VRSTAARGGRAPTCPSRNRSPPRNDAERRAARWYRLRGYRILAANCWLAGGELDLVVRRGRRIVFCEVKSKSGTTFGDPLEMVDEAKVRRIYAAADAWLARRPELDGLEVRFDLIAERSGRLEHVPNAF